MEEGMEDGGCSRSSFCALAACWPHPAKVDNSAGIPDADAVKEVSTESPRKQAMEHHFAKEPDSVNLSNGRQQSTSSPPLLHFSYNDLKVATRNFRPDSLLGEGGFGCVFKGWIDEHGTAPARPGSGRTVAVKILNTSGHQGHKEWLAEINFLGQLYHPNLVKLIGFCNEQDQRLLVYECIPRGSLENHLFRRGAFPLPWNVRMKVALGVARGVWFLHSGKNGNKPVIYRDLKASNILLDLDFTAKLSDFGLAKAGPEGDKSYVSTRIMGTLGYAAPEYVMTGHLTMMSDVYSFGVLLLELLTGKRCVDKNRPADQHNLVGWARPSLCEKKKLFKVMDDRLGGHYSSKGSQKAGQLAHACLTRDPKRRPTMGEVVTALEHIQDLKDMVNADIPLKGGDRARGAAKFSVP